MGIADFAMVFAGFLEYLLTWIGSQANGFTIIRVARLCRLVRLMSGGQLVYIHTFPTWFSSARSQSSATNPHRKLASCLKSMVFFGVSEMSCI